MYRRAGRADIGYTIVRPGGLTNGPASPVSALELRCALARLGPPGARPSPRGRRHGARLLRRRLRRLGGVAVQPGCGHGDVTAMSRRRHGDVTETSRRLARRRPLRRPWPRSPPLR